MVEQQQIRRERQRRQRRQVEGKGVTLASDETFRETEAQLQRLDAAIDDILSDPPMAGPSVAIGAQDRHQLRPLTAETLVKGFRQQGGE